MFAKAVRITEKSVVENFAKLFYVNSVMWKKNAVKEWKI